MKSLEFQHEKSCSIMKESKNQINCKDSEKIFIGKKEEEKKV